MTETAPTINPEDRGLAACTHLSGLAGYIIPLGGAIKASQGDYYRYPVVGLPPG